MWILALETSTELGSCALWHDGQVTERFCPVGRPHSETLLPLVRELLSENGVTIRQLSAIAFGVGPGAFTGLRVACGVAQGLAVAADLPMIPVTSLEAMASLAGQPKVLALLDARMGEVYAGRYRMEQDGPVRVGDIVLARPEDVAIPDGAGWFACGNAIAAYPPLAVRLGEAGLAALPEVLPTAATVARLAAPRCLRGEGIDPAEAAPLYVRDKVAKTVAERLGEGGRA